MDKSMSKDASSSGSLSSTDTMLQDFIELQKQHLELDEAKVRIKRCENNKHATVNAWSKNDFGHLAKCHYLTYSHQVPGHCH